MFEIIRNEELGMSNDVKTCVDCLHCKVSVKSTKDCRLCYCAVSKNKLKYQETYWLTKKKVCIKFDDMSA